MMGAWGDDILQNDSALDYLGDVLSFAVDSTDRNFRAIRERDPFDVLGEAQKAMAGVMAARVLIDFWPAGCHRVAESIRGWQSDLDGWFESTDYSTDEDLAAWKRNADREFALTLELLRELNAPGMREGELPEVGSTYVMKLDDGRYGACRVLRSFKAGSDATEWYKGPYLLIGYTAWIGRKPPSIDEPRLREILVRRRERQVLFADEPPDDDFRFIGVIPPSNAEKRLKCNVFGGGWNSKVPFIGGWIDANREAAAPTGQTGQDRSSGGRKAATQRKQASKPTRKKNTKKETKKKVGKKKPSAGKKGGAKRSSR